MSKHIIGVDGGGTKTLAVLFDETGKIIKRHETGFSNFSIDEQTAKLNIIEAIDEIYNTLDDPKDLMIVIGVAGLAKLRGKETFKAQVQTRFKADVLLETDALIALHSVPNPEHNSVIMAIGGTGSVVMAGEGLEVTMIGGFGHLLGDEGSAYHFVKNTLKYVIDDFESHQTASDFSKTILKKLKIDDYHNLIDFMYNQSKSEIAQFSKVIVGLEQDGFNEVKTLLEKEASFAADLIIKGYHKLNNQQNVIIALRGGFITQAPHVKDTLIESLNQVIKDYTLDLSNKEPVTGAYYLGSLKKQMR